MLLPGFFPFRTSAPSHAGPKNALPEWPPLWMRKWRWMGKRVRREEAKQLAGDSSNTADGENQPRLNESSCIFRNHNLQTARRPPRNSCNNSGYQLEPSFHQHSVCDFASSLVSCKSFFYPPQPPPVCPRKRKRKEKAGEATNMSITQAGPPTSS